MKKRNIVDGKIFFIYGRNIIDLNKKSSFFAVHLYALWFMVSAKSLLCARSMNAQRLWWCDECLETEVEGVSDTVSLLHAVECITGRFFKIFRGNRCPAI